MASTIAGLLFVLGGIAFAIWGGAEEEEPIDGPELSISPLRIDFGQVRRLDAPSRFIRLESVGTEPVRIVAVKSGCGCFIASYEGEIGAALAPGMSVEVEVSLDARGRQGKTTKPVTIYSDRRGGVPLTVMCTVEVLPDKPQAQPQKMPVGSSSNSASSSSRSGVESESK